MCIELVRITLKFAVHGRKHTQRTTALTAGQLRKQTGKLTVGLETNVPLAMHTKHSVHMR